MSAFIKTVQNTAHKHNLWSRGSKIIVGVSGGPDSICLLDVLVFLSKKYEWQLRIAHVNYGLRDNDSDADALFVKKLAKQYKLPCSVLKPKITKQTNLEEYLRNIRYIFFEKLRTKYKFDSIAVAHTLDDQAETVLMRLIRGSGLSGLRAMQVKNGFIIRPLLEITRKDIMRYIGEQHLTYRTDDSNTDTKFLRNNIRHRLIPYLQKNFNPNIRDVLAHTARVVAEEYDMFFLTQEQSSIPFQHTDHTLTFQIKDLLALNQGRQQILLRDFFKLVRGHLKGITSKHTYVVLDMFRSEKSKIKTLSFAKLIITSVGTRATITLAKTLKK